MDLSNPGTMNRYAYVGGDPINSTDAQGLEGGDGCGNGTWATDFGSCAPMPFDSDPADNPANWGYIVCSDGTMISAFAPPADLSGCYGPGGDPEGPAQASYTPLPRSCTIQLWQRPAFLKGNPGHHTYVLASDPSLFGGVPGGTEMFEGGPDHNPGWQNGTLMGFINAPGTGLGQGSSHASDPGASNNHEIGATYAGSDACSDIETMLEDINLYNAGQRVPYYALGTFNSNSFTYTLLSETGLASFFTPNGLPTHITFHIKRPFYPGWNQVVPGL
jgi:hypothetical protein